MPFFADLHIHSHFSLATSKHLTPEHLHHGSLLKGIKVLGTGDCIHPGWLRELKEKLEPAGGGLFQLKREFLLPETRELFPAEPEVYFLLSGEISSIYKKGDRVRKVHNIAFFPDFDSLERVQRRLERIGNIESDGRPILGLDSKILLEMVLESSPFAFLIPAHIWTPWFSLLGSRSGFDSPEECFEDLTPHIFAVETGLSSDPPMNRTCSFLDSLTLVSNSDAHSPEKLGREANLFDTEFSYFAIHEALKRGVVKREEATEGGGQGTERSGRGGFLGTVEFFPEEGKYHYDGHRNCSLRWDPLETLRHGGVCPRCGKPVTVGVMHRVAELSDRSAEDPLTHRDPFRSITPLPEILAEVTGQKSSSSVKIKREYLRLIRALGSEFDILLNLPPDRVTTEGGELLGEAIGRLRRGEVVTEEGYDGEFGRVRLFRPGELQSPALFSLFDVPSGHHGGENETPSIYSSLRFDFDQFKELRSSSPSGDSPKKGESREGKKGRRERIEAVESYKEGIRSEPPEGELYEQAGESPSNERSENNPISFRDPFVGRAPDSV